jgi:hypothetical protein
MRKEPKALYRNTKGAKKMTILHKTRSLENAERIKDSYSKYRNLAIAELNGTYLVIELSEKKNDTYRRLYN